jgi:hypothetical protein
VSNEYYCRRPRRSGDRTLVYFLLRSLWPGALWGSHCTAPSASKRSRSPRNSVRASEHRCTAGPSAASEQSRRVASRRRRPSGRSYYSSSSPVVTVAAPPAVRRTETRRSLADRRPCPFPPRARARARAQTVLWPSNRAVRKSSSPLEGVFTLVFYPVP